MSLARSLILLFAMVTTTRAASPLAELAAWPGLIAQAKECGIPNYPTIVERAEKNEMFALTTVFNVTPCTDGHAGEVQSAILRRLLEELGDKTFSRNLRGMPPRLQISVAQALDFAFGKPWQQFFPMTHALGSHDTLFLRGRRDI